MTDHHKWRLLGWLALVWLALGLIRVMTDPEPQRIPLVFRSAHPVVAASARTAAHGPTLVRPIQAEAGDPPFTPPKNIFAPLEPLTEAPNGRSVNAQDRAPGNIQPAAPATVSSPASALALPPPSHEDLATQRTHQQREQARQQMAQYRFLGYLSRGGEQRAFLQKGREIYIMRPGEMAEGHIQVMAIDPGAVTLKETATNLEATLPLVKREDGTF